jgi:hypothetical protein
LPVLMNEKNATMRNKILVNLRINGIIPQGKK